MLTIFLVIICVLRDRRPFLANWGHAVPSSLTLPCRTPSTKRYEKRDPFTPPGYHPNHIDAQLLSQSLCYHFQVFESFLEPSLLRNVRDRIRWKIYFSKASRFSQNWWNTTFYTFVDVRIAEIEGLRHSHHLKALFILTSRILNLYKKTATTYLDFL